jgi:hypothetical protein
MASGGPVGPATIIVTVDGAESTSPSLTMSEKPKAAGPCGATNEAWPAADVSNVTEGPEVCDHLYVSGSESGSLLAFPSKVTLAPEATAALAPAEAVGGELTIVIVTVDGGEDTCPSLTVNEKASAPDFVGAVNVGLAAAAELSVTAVPAVCDQA